MCPRVVISGPTAVGKTAVGIALARRLGTEIVSADALQVYRRMEIGTVKPTAAEQAQAKFHAINVADPDDEWTLADYQLLAGTACDTLAAQGQTPLIVGGTGLYVRALTTVLDIPAAPPDDAFRQEWRAIAAARGTRFVQEQLAKVDAPSAARIHVNDLGRLIRALEVYRATGVALSEWHARNRAQTQLLDVRLFALNYADRRELYTRIEARVDAMMDAGFLSEVRGLLDAGYGRELRPMQALGYRQLAEHLAGSTSIAEAVEQIKRDTRHFARRQLIWFRADPRLHWLDVTDKTADDLAHEIASLMDDANQQPQQGHATE